MGAPILIISRPVWLFARSTDVGKTFTNYAWTLLLFFGHNTFVGD